jgi:hypothetical protein
LLCRLRQINCESKLKNSELENKNKETIMEMMANSGSYFVGWRTLALINAGLAQGKGRRGLIWFLISLLLGPVATFILLLVDDLK